MIAFSDGGLRLATRHCELARYEIPSAPTRPLHHGRFAIHSIAS
jgi:hypothetical protein